jgi:phosphotransferase system  glucose/maltose/N-acetylglucosamine-specific IIC component
VTLSAFGPEPWSFVQIAICVAMAIALGFVFVFLTQKELFGNKFDMKIKRE